MEGILGTETIAQITGCSLTYFLRERERERERERAAVHAHAPAIKSRPFLKHPKQSILRASWAKG